MSEPTVTSPEQALEALEVAIDTKLAEYETEIASLRSQLAALSAERDGVLALVSEQANDEGLWFRPKYATEDYLQRALRRLHSAVEGKHSAPPTPGGEPAGKEQGR